MAAPWEDLAPTNLAPWESSPVPQDAQDGALIRGVKRATNSARTAFNLATGDAETGAQLAAERAAYEQANPGTKAGNELMDAWRRGDGVTGGISEVAGEMKKDWQEAPNLIGSVKATGENLSAMGGGIVEQIPNMVAPMAGMGAGALAGSAAFGPGAGTLTGMWAGASAGNTAMESAEKVDQALRTAGINPSDKPAVEAFLRENGSAVLGQAAVKGSIIGLVDTITMKLGSKLLLGPAEAATARAIESLGLNIADKGAIKAAESKIAAQVAADPAYLAAKTGTQGLARNVGAAALEPAGEFVGEFAGEGVSTGDWDTKNAALEALSAIGQGAITFAGQKAYDLATSPLRKAQSPLEPTTGELDEANAAIDLPMQQYTDLPGAVPLLQGPPDVIEVPTATGTTEIRRTDGALSAAVIDTGVADALAAGMPLRSMTKQQATEDLANRPDADRLQIIPHPVSGAMGRYAIVEKPAQQLADLDAKAAAAAESQVRAEQLRAEEDTRRGQGQALKDVATIEKRVVELNRAAASLESTIKDGTPPADAAVIREQAKDLRAQAKEIHDQLGEVKKNAAKPAQMAPQEVQTNDAEAAQEELIPSLVQPVSEMPATQKVREAARTTAETRTAQLVDEEASVANPEPTPGQIAAGNYKKGHIKIGPLNIAIENPAGTIRKGIENGKKWATNMLAHYGYMKRTEGADGDQVDAFVKQGTPTDYSGPVFVVDQYNPKTGQFDEHKAMIGYASQAEAQVAYDAHFSDKSGPKRRRAVTEMTPAAFKTWAEKGDTTQPVVQTDEAQAEIAQSTGARFARKRGESLDAYQRRMADEKNAKKRNRAIPAADTVAADLKEATGVEGTIVKSDTLPDAADAPAGQLSRQAADFMTKVAKLFGKEIAIVDDMAGGDGLYVRGNTIYVSTKSTVAHLRILGHEMLHALKNQAPKAYAAMLKAVQAITTDAQLRAQVRDYYTDKKDWTDAQVDAWLKQDGNKDTITEEWMADLSGNRWAESSFWESVFAKIGEQHSSETAKGIIAQLKMAITNALNKLMAAIKGNAFAVDARVAEHLDEIREAFAQGFADYAKAIKDNQAVDHDAARARFAKKASASDHKMQITREERELADKTKLTRDELTKVTRYAKQFGLTPKQVEMEVRRIKARFPETAGWAPLTFLRVDPKTLSKKANEKTPLPSDAIFFEPYSYQFHLDDQGKANKVSHNKRVKDIASALAGEITGKYMAAQQGDPIAKVIMRQTDWYQSLRGKLRSTFGGFGDFLAQLLGPTSANNPVEPNFKYGVEALKLATSGKWDNLFKEIFAWKAEVEAAAQALDDTVALVKAEGQKGVMADPRVKTAMAELKTVSKYKGTVPLRENGKQFGMASAGIQQILAEEWGDKVRGDAPKTKNYYQNIMGRTFDATIDVWAARTLRRLANDIVGNFPRIPPVAETAVAGNVLADNITSGSEFGFGQEVFKQAAADLRASGIEQFKNTTPDAVQAMIWFAEKELWARRDWTTKVGEEGSIEHEMLLAGFPDRAQVDAWRVAARAGHPNPDTKAFKGKDGKFRQDTFEKAVAKWQDAKAIAAAELAKIEQYPDRFVAGVTTEIPDSKPTDAEMADTGRELEAAAADNKVMAIRAVTSTGEFMGDFERTLDVEVVARNGYDATPLWNKLVEIGDREGQQAVFLSRVLREDEIADPLTHRPGVELYFAKSKTLAEVQPLMDLINAAGVHGMTMATEGRRTPGALTGKDQPITGIRMQHIPEFMLGFGYNVSMANTDLASAVAEAEDRMDDLVLDLKKRGDVATVSRYWYETRVHFYGNNSRIAGGETGQGPGTTWTGQRISEGLEGADRFARDGTAPLAARRDQLRADRQVSRGNAAKRSTKRSDAASDGRDGARNASEPGQGPGYGTGQPGAVTVQGTHYSQQERASLDGRYYGTGMRGAEGPRVRAAADPRLKERVYFYVNKGTGVRPEDGVGAIAHTAQLNNVYDTNADTWVQAKVDRALSGDERMNAFESAVIDNGFDGYVTDFGTQRAAVLLGRHNVPVARGQGGVSEAKQKAETAGDRINASRSLPSGRMTGAEWKRLVPEATMLNDDQGYYRSDVAMIVDRAGPPAKFSLDRTPIFYSQLERQIGAAKIDNVPAGQWKNWLVANAGKLGIKQDEIQWTGINEFLDILGKGKITKQQVLDYLDQGGVKIEDVMKGSQGYDENNPQLPADGGLSVEPSENDRWNYQVQTDEGEILGYGDSFRSAVSDAYSGYPEYWDKADSTKYDSYTLPGGENYRELLLTLPPLRPLTNAWRSAQEKFGDDDLRTIGAKSAAKAEAKGNNTYKSSHWDEANILAHIRFNERTDADGKRVLFIEEIQSDWGQAGKKTGFGATRVSERQEADFRALKERIASVTGDDSIFRTGNIEHNRGLAEKAGLLQEFNAAMVAMWDAQSRNMEQVPAAPFVTDTKSWVALAMKRMMRYAADNGFEKIAFVNGEQSADRYDLAKQAEAVRANLNHDGTYQLGVQPIGGRMQHHDTSVPKDKLEDAVGKDLANKIISEVTEVGVDNGKVFSGLDLKVGGTGMIKFYNEIVPQVASALLKKMGGKLEQIIIPRGDLKYHPVGYKPDYTETTQPGFTVPAAASEPMAMFSLKRRVNDTLAKVDHAVDGLSNLPNQFDYLKDRYLALGKIARVDEISKEIRHSLNKASDADKKAIYNYLTTRGATVGQITDPAVRLIAKRIKDTIEYTGDQLVARGLLDQQARDHYRDQYLPRMYLRHLLDDNSAKIIGMGKKPSDLGYLKHRKDIPVEIRELVLGEVKDPSFLSVNAIGRAMRDISLMDWMGKISLNNDWVFPEIFTQWNGRRVTAYWLRAEADRIERQAEHYDATNKPLAMAKVAQMRTQANQTLGQMQAVDHKKYKQIPDTMRYGLLRGMYVRTEIYNDIMGASQIVNADPTWFEDWFGFGGKGTKLTQWWKFTKVALNPPGQIRNFVSNMVMLQLSGVGLHKLPFRLIEAARDISSNGPYWKIAKKYGVTESTFTAQELFRVKRDLIDLEAKVGRAHPLRFLMAAGASFLEKVSDLYQFSEALGKTIKIMDEMKAGKSEAEAAIEAQKWLFDYSLVPQSVRIARNAPIGMPFLTYQIKVLPRLMEVATKYPWRFLPWVGLLYGMQAAVASMFGVDDDELKKLKKSLPEWLQDRSHTVFLPMRDADGRLQVADVGYFFPWTFYSQIGMHAADGKIKKALVDDIGGMFSAPIIGAGAALMSNYDTFTHKPIYNESDPTGYQAAAIANYAYDLMAPPFLSSHGVVSPMGLADKKFGGKLVQALGNTTNKFGDPKATEEQAIGALVGFNFYGMDPEHTRITNMQVMNMKVREAEKALRNRLMDRGLGDEERGKVMRDYQSRMLELQQEMVDYAKESDVPQQLRVLKRQ